MTQTQALAIMKTGVNVYLTGSAGAGKTYVLNQYIRYLKEHDISVAVTASTGIAATHMNGQTVHGWSGIGIRESLTPQDLENLEEKKYLWSRFESARVLIIDEVSMLSGRVLDMVDAVARKFKRNDKPFGGLQVILSGDLFQLPPVQKNSAQNQNNMIIYSTSWKNMNLAVCYLSEQHRQEDDALLDILNAIRQNSIEDSHYELLQTRYNAELPEDINPTKLYTHNTNVDAENNSYLNKIDSESKTYTMSSVGRDIVVEILKKSCLAQETLILKKGAEVMFIKNNPERGYANGTRGRVEGFDFSGMPIVRLYNGKLVTVEHETWAIEEDGKQKAALNQIPLRLAWAITVHKSQGMSLDNAEIDLSNTFAYGMGYVALSRVRTLAGIRLVGFNAQALAVDPDILEFDKQLKIESSENENLFSKLTKEEQQKLEENFILRMGGTLSVTKKIDEQSKKIKKIPTHLVTKEFLEQGMSIKEIALQRGYTAGTIVGHIEEIVKEFPDTSLTHIRPDEECIKKVKAANAKLKEEDKIDDIGKLTPLKSALEKSGCYMSFEEIRLARLFI